MASAMNKRLEGLSLDSQASGASVENINMMDIGEFDLGIAMNATADDAWNGRMPLRIQARLRASVPSALFIMRYTRSLPMQVRMPNQLQT